MRPLGSTLAPLRRRTRPAVRPAPPPVSSPEQRARNAGGPEDRALYGCGCGAAFRADMQADVSCPACGAAQSW